MIQLKPGITPSSLNKNAKSRRTRKSRMANKKDAALRFDRVFSDAAVTPFDQIEWERRTAEITDDSGKVIFKQENIEVPKSWSRARDKDRGLEIFLRRHRQRDRPAQGRSRNVGAAADSSRHAHDHGLGNRRRLFRRCGNGGNFLRRADLALRESARRVQLAGLVQRRALSSIRRSAGTPGAGIISTIARPARPSAPRRSTNIRRAAPVSSNRSTTRWKTSCAWR